MQRKMMVCTIVVSLCSMIAMSTWAGDDFKRWNNPRDYDPVVLSGTDIPGELISLPINELFVYSYDAAMNSWMQIPFQIDKMDTSGFAHEPVSGDTLGIEDEIIFMARDMGDQAADGSYWIDDEDSKNYNRYEIMTTDGEQQAWVYIYRSATLTYTAGSYMSYVTDPAGWGADIVNAITYSEGHNKYGIPENWTLPINGGTEILDRQKVMMIVVYTLFGQPIDFPMRENILEADESFQYVRARVGPVRIVREAYWIVDASSLGYEPFPFSLLVEYYPYKVESEGLAFTFKASYKIKYFRQTYDLNANAVGMKLYNKYNPTGLNINGNPADDTGINTQLDDPPAINWYLITGNQGTFAYVFKLTEIGTTRELYYRDNSAKDGNDTGDQKSYGETGIRLEQTYLDGRLSIGYSAYYLGPNEPYALGETLAHNFEFPLVTSSQSSSYFQWLEAAVSVPQTSAPEQSTVQIPINISDVTGYGITSATINLKYDTSILDALNVITTGTIASAWAAPAFSEDANGISFELSGATPLSGSGNLAVIEFKVIGDDGQSTNLEFDSVTFEPFNVIATLTNGSCAVDPGIVVISMPDTSQAAGTTISIPVTVSDVTGLDITGVKLYVRIDSAVLDPLSVTTENTIAANWPAPAFTDQTSTSVIEMNGTTPLEGAGPLVYINYNIIGADKATSTLKLVLVYFNSGSPKSQKVDGVFTVDGVVPVELTSFTASVTNGTVKLSWSTATETNNYGFEIQRKLKEDTIWEKLGFVKGNGTSTTPQSYSFIDSNFPAGTYEFRLKQVDFDGSFELSNTIEVTINAATTFALGQNYPNPFNPVTRINYQVPGTIKNQVRIEMKIYNLLGSEIRTLVSKEQPSGYYTITWDGTDESGNLVPTGVYIYQMRSGHFVATRRLVLMK